MGIIVIITGAARNQNAAELLLVSNRPHRCNNYSRLKPSCKGFLYFSHYLYLYIAVGTFLSLFCFGVLGTACLAL